MARMTVNEQEQALIEKARELAQLQAKRRKIAADLEACDQDISMASAELRALTPRAETAET